MSRNRTEREESPRGRGAFAVDFLAGDRWRVLVAAVLIHLACIVAVNRLVLQDFPNSADEYSYLLSAHLFAEGKLSVPSPPVREFFVSFHVVNNGRYYGKYPPGWPAILALGVLAGSPFLVNALLSCTALAVLHRLVVEHLSLLAANLASLLAATSPFLIFNAASYFSHTSCLCFCVCSYLFFSRALRSGRFTEWIAAGVVGGIAFTIRPYTAVLAWIPLWVWLARTCRDDARRIWTSAGAVVLGAAPFALLFLAYNHAQTGNAFLQPYTVYDPADHPRLPVSAAEWRFALRYNVVLAVANFVVWSPFVLVIPCAVAFLRPKSEPTRPSSLALFLAAPLCQLLGQLLYLRTPGNQYGPRYLFEMGFALVALAGWAMSLLARRSMLGFGAAFCAAVASSMVVLVNRAEFHGAQVKARVAPYTLTAQAGLSSAIVLLTTGSGTMPREDLVRNGTHFDGPVLYALDRGGDDERLLAAFPRRTCFRFENHTQAESNLGGGHAALFPCIRAQRR